MMIVLSYDVSTTDEGGARRLHRVAHVCERYGVPPTPDAAWEAGGGGSFSFKIDKKGGRKRGRVPGCSSMMMLGPNQASQEQTLGEMQ